jgi:uncharacterized protein (DUF433 family)
MKFREYIIRDSKIKNGAPIIKGTQVTLKVVLGHLALGDSIENIVKTYPEITPESVRAVIAYAAAAVEADVPGEPGSPQSKIILEKMKKMMKPTDQPE